MASTSFPKFQRGRAYCSLDFWNVGWMKTTEISPLDEALLFFPPEDTSYTPSGGLSNDAPSRNSEIFSWSEPTARTDRTHLVSRSGAPSSNLARESTHCAPSGEDTSRDNHPLIATSKPKTTPSLSRPRTLSPSTELCSQPPPPVKKRRRLAPVDSELLPMKVKIRPGESPYHRPQFIKLYGPDKPVQTWFYDQQRYPIVEPPSVIPRGAVVPFKSLYICDWIDPLPLAEDGSGRRCLDRQIWINNCSLEEQEELEEEREVELELELGGGERGERGKVTRWTAVAGRNPENMKQVIDGEVYVCYVRNDGPHWVKRKSWVGYGRRGLGAK